MEHSKNSTIRFCYISIAFFLLLIIFNFQSNNATQDSFNQTLSNKALIPNDNTTSTNLKIGENNLDNPSAISENRVTLGPDRESAEGSVISLKPVITNAISIPSKSVSYTWKQLEGPKINLEDYVKHQSTLTFIAPNRPGDTKYAFEINAIQKKSNQNINLGKDSINILVLDTNIIAKGLATNSNISKDTLDTTSNFHNQLN